MAPRALLGHSCPASNFFAFDFKLSGVVLAKDRGEWRFLLVMGFLYNVVPSLWVAGVRTSLTSGVESILHASLRTEQG